MLKSESKKRKIVSEGSIHNVDFSRIYGTPSASDHSGGGKGRGKENQKNDTVLSPGSGRGGTAEAGNHRCDLSS